MEYRKSFNNPRLRLPDIDFQFHLSASPFQVLHRWINIGWDAISIDIWNIRKYLDQPSELLADLQEAANVQEKARADESRPVYDYWIERGLVYPTERAPYDRDSASENFATILQRDLRTGKTVGVTHFITVREHERRIAQVMDSIEDAVKRGVTSGIKTGVKDSQMSMKEILSERKELEREREVIAARLKKLEQMETDAKTRAPRSTAGYVYLLQSESGYWKIGRTANPDNRLKTFNVKLPFQVAYKHLIQTDDMYTLEAQLHSRYAEKRVEGEWFLLTEQDVIDICNL